MADISKINEYNIKDKKARNDIAALTVDKVDKTELSNYATKEYVDGAIEDVDVTEQLKDYAKKTDLPVVPTKVSQLTNDSNFLTSVPSEYVTEAELTSKGYITEHQDISSKLDKNLGAENAGKMLVVGSDGNIIVMDIPSGEGVFGDITGTVDENNNILLVGDLADGTYVLKYENKDGTYSDVGTLVISAIEDDNSEVVEGNLFNLETTKINTRFSSSGSEKTQNGVWLTDLIPLDVSTHHSIYVKNAIMSRNVGTAPSPVVSFFGEGGTYLGQIQCNSANGGYINYTEVLGDRYTRIKLNTAYTTENSWWSSVKFMRIAGVEDESGAEITKDSIADVIIKLNEEII